MEHKILPASEIDPGMLILTKDLHIHVGWTSVDQIAPFFVTFHECWIMELDKGTLFTCPSDAHLTVVGTLDEFVRDGNCSNPKTVPYYNPFYVPEDPNATMIAGCGKCIWCKAEKALRAPDIAAEKRASYDFSDYGRED